ncbi:MAG: HAD-IIB family hydrolase [Deltaproteobacteria bacterium]|jgi:sucrose-6F-phosphate phosphohydrolase|nr:HAD-IIB family hydrolase [Deltaproteobacteria bacterium]
MIGSDKILVCSDLDRTLIPNGFQEESAPARPVLRRLADNAHIYLAYVSGRDRDLIRDAIEEFYLPEPDYAIGDVGTTLYRITNGNWQLSDAWSDQISRDWHGYTREALAEFLEDVDDIRLQEPEKQNVYKLSFYTDAQVDRQRLVEQIRIVLDERGVSAHIIWSVDEISTTGLLDIVPARANKLRAIRFLMQQERFSEVRTVFAGDSGNDLDVLTSGLQAILVKNATEDVRKHAIESLSATQMTERLYLPRGNFFGMNGHYAAGVLEGLAHFIPETENLIAHAVAQVD